MCVGGDPKGEMTHVCCKCVPGRNASTLCSVLGAGGFESHWWNILRISVALPHPGRVAQEFETDPW